MNDYIISSLMVTVSAIVFILVVLKTDKQDIGVGLKIVSIATVIAMVVVSWIYVR